MQDFENLLMRYKTGAYSHYVKNPKSVGSVAHFLYVYGLPQYDSVQISEKKIILHGRIMGSFSFSNDMPTFKFSKGYDWLKDSQRIFLNGLNGDFHLKSNIYKEWIVNTDYDLDFFYINRIKLNKHDPIVFREFEEGGRKIIINSVDELYSLVKQMIDKKVDKTYVSNDFMMITKSGVKKFKKELFGLSSKQLNELFKDYIW